MKPEHALGEIIGGLIDRVLFVRISKVDSVLGDFAYTLQVAVTKRGRHVVMSHMLTTLELERVNDPRVVADAIVERLRKAEPL